MTFRPSTAARILAVLAIVLPLALYVGGYFWLAESIDGTWAHVRRPDDALTVRSYHQRWMVPFFIPAGWLESRLRQRVIILESPEQVQVFYS